MAEEQRCGCARGCRCGFPDRYIASGGEDAAGTAGQETGATRRPILRANETQAVSSYRFSELFGIAKL
jgi:hypothetical protein